ncbi:MAG: hypothetical protein DMG65_12850 [Candidatus Angelobacter sp. Gp1-AA117]|nr:MAG: hypothetical protein DMG65_12850 [Candidatus Angelobacter sp. Gp1-AA117]
MKRLLIPALLALCLVALPAFSQQFPPKGDDITTSLGSFRIEVTNPNFANLFNGCPGYDSTKKIFQSPTLFDPATRIGRSDPILDDSAADQNGLPVGNDNTLVPESALMPPGSFGFGSGTREVHTEVRALKMTGSGMMVRGGVWYNDPNNQTPPSRISPGEVESHSGPGGQPANDFPASSFFDVFVKVDLPACGAFGFPGTTLFNTMPLIVKNDNLLSFPPKVAYLHDPTVLIPIYFFLPGTATPPPPNVPITWRKGDILGYFLLAGHGVGFSNSPSDQSQFNGMMSTQPDAQCPLMCPPPAPSPSPTSTGTSKTTAQQRKLPSVAKPK